MRSPKAPRRRAVIFRSHGLLQIIQGTLRFPCAGCRQLSFCGLAIWGHLWKRFRKWGGIPTGITQNIKDLLASPEIENIFENSDFIYLLNQASGDRKILCERLNISTQQAAHISNAGPGEGLIFFGNVILPFVDHFPQDNELYSIMTTKLGETGKGGTAHE